MDEKDIPGVDDGQDSRGEHGLEKSKSEEEVRIGEQRNENETDEPKPRPTSLQQKMLAMAGQDIDQFMKEVLTQTIWLKLFNKVLCVKNLYFRIPDGRSS